MSADREGHGTPVVRWNARGQRYVVGKDQDGRVGLFAEIKPGLWRPYDEIDLKENLRHLRAETGEVLYVSLYRMPKEEEAYYAARPV